MFSYILIGIFESSFTVDYPVNAGQWTMMVDAFVSTYMLNYIL